MPPLRSNGVACTPALRKITETEFMKFTNSRSLALIGGLIMLGFGLWHSVTPWLYHWFDYIPSAPDELVKAITATNFFLSVALVLMGVLTIAITIWQWHNVAAVKLVLRILSVLWLIRAGYQIIMPQAAHAPCLAAFRHWLISNYPSDAVQSPAASAQTPWDCPRTDGRF